MERERIDTYKRIFVFVLETFRASRIIPNTLETITIKKQLLSSASSIGANAQEADGTDSRKDFISKLKIAKKEAKETLYWLCLLRELSPTQQSSMYNQLIQECDQILRILSAIIIKSKK